MGHVGDPGVGGAKGLGGPGVGHGGAKGLGDSGVGGAKGLGDPGVGHGVGHVGDPGVGQTMGQSGQAFGQPGVGQAFGQPGVGQPFGQPGVAQAGASISIKGFLIAAAAIVAVIVAAIGAFLVLRPDPPRQTAEQQSPTAAANPTGATPGAANAGEPLLRGTYNGRVTVTSSAGTTTNDTVQTATSDCPHCDVTFSGSGGSNTFHWNGGAWELQPTGPICAGGTVTLTPTVVANGFVQELSQYYATCNGTVVTGTLTRTGD